MPLIEFEYIPIEQTPTWGKEDEKYVNWFILGFASFTLNLDGKKLFRLSDEYLALEKQGELYWARKYGNYAIDYLGYLYTDILSRFVDMFQPIPDNLFWKIESFAKHKSFMERMKKVDQNTDVLYEDYSEAMQWLWDRSLDTSYYFPCPEIYFLRHNSTIIVRWFASHIREGDITVLHEPDGEAVMTADEFLAEITNFHNTYLDTMKERLDLWIKDYPQPGVDFDAQASHQAYEKHKNEFGTYIQRQPITSKSDWFKIEAAINKLEVYYQSLLN